MKLKRFLICTLFSIFFLPLCVKADIMDVSSDESLKSYLNTGANVRLTDNITLNENTFINADSTIDLNGYTITMNASTLIPYAELTIKDTSDEHNGKITGSNTYIIQVGSSKREGSLIVNSGSIDCSSKNYCVTITAKGKLILNGGYIESRNFPVVVSGELDVNNGEILATNGSTIYVNTNGLFTLNNGLVKTTADYEVVTLSKPGSKFIMNGGKVEALNETGYKGSAVSAFKDTEFIMNGGEIIVTGAAIMGNGSISGKNEGTNAKFTINDGTITSTQTLAIYAPQPNGLTTINGGIISGATSGIEIRAGKLVVNGGTISGNTENYVVETNTNGSGVTGAAIAIVQHTTKLPIEVIINNGTFNGSVPLVETNPLNNAEEYTSQISYEVTNGTFNSTGNETVLIEDLSDGFITGGTFTHSVNNYVKEGYGEKEKNDKHVVLKKITVTNNNDEQAPTVEAVLPGDEIVIDTKTDDNFDLVYFYVKDDNGNQLTIDDNKFIVGDTNVTINTLYTKTLIKDNTNDLIIADEEDAKQAMYKSFTTDKDLLDNINTTKTTIELIVDEKELTDEEKNKIIEQLNTKNDCIIRLFDIYIVIKDEKGNIIKEIKELPKDIEIEFILNDLINTNNVQNFYVVRNHDKYEILNSVLSIDGKKLIFKSNKYSEFAIAIENVKKEEEKPENNTEKKEDKKSNPITNDSIVKYIVILGVSTLAIVCLIIYKKTNK